jgi:hypothetical protein
MTGIKTQLSCSIAAALCVLLGTGQVAEAADGGGVPLTGEYLGPAEVPAIGAAEELEKAGPALTEARPVLDPDLAAQAESMDSREMLRVVIFLKSSPSPAAADGPAAEQEAELQAIRDRMQEIIQASNQYRADWLPFTDSDAENYEEMVGAMSEADRIELRQLGEQHETLSAEMARQTGARLAAALQPAQQRVREALAGLGGQVEFTTTAAGAVVALVPAGQVAQIARLPDVARVTNDKRMEGGLDVADDATLITSTKPGGGLWDNSYTGGLYDPAVVDSGTDLSHPFLDADADRENHWSWYLAAGAADPDYCDVTSGDEVQWVDDLQGHGTHVMGIVASEGSTTYPQYLGMAYGVDKTVHLKAGWLNCTTGRASMWWSDMMWLVDRALQHQDELRPSYGTDVFLDDVDGFNLSYGGDTTLDDPDGSRFWDSVVDDWTDMVFTVAAGNSGPTNTLFNDPATTYNGITVANVDDQNTTSRSDDTIWTTSTRGPTASGRRKPDIAAPGRNIRSANNEWETELDYIDKTGTSMAAPMVQGVAMDLMDAGVTDELAIKALLLNTAQKNEAGINFESDLDGWSEAYGWGYMNAWAAYYHRGDVHLGSVTPRPTAGYYQLYAGQMRDEGSGGEGRDRATLVWNRHATYTDHSLPSLWHSVNDLDLWLYDANTGNYISGDATIVDNTQQVRMNTGAGLTDTVVKVVAWSSAFAEVTSEPYALATEENFVPVDLPATFQGFGNWPTQIEANAERDFQFWLRNDSDIASHNNQFEPILPAGWTLVSGPNPFFAGSIAADGYSSTATWRLRAPSATGSYQFKARHTHTSYGVSWGPYDWNMPVNVVPEGTLYPRVTGIWTSDPVVVGNTLSLFVFGDNFNLTPGATQVFVNGIQQFLVQVMTEEMLIVRVNPVTAGMIGGPVTVTTSWGSASSTTDFGVPLIGLNITGIWPVQVTNGQWTSIFVFGSGFDAAPGGTQVSINGVPQPIVAVVTPDMLIVRVLASPAIAGPVTVTTGAGSVTSTESVVVSP